MKTKIASMVLDILTGLVAFVLFLVGDSYLHVAADLRSAAVSLAALYLCAGFIRGRNGSVWLKSLLVGGSGALVLEILLWAQLFHMVLAVLLLTTVLFGLFGVSARHYLVAHSAIGASLIVVVPLAVLTIVAMATFPVLAPRIATRAAITPAPVFEVGRLDGSLVRSTDWRGHVVVLDYWATWCPRLPS